MIKLSFDENLLVTAGDVKAVFVPYCPDEDFNCGNYECLLHDSRTGECSDAGGLFHCVEEKRRDRLSGWWKEAE